MQSKIKNKIKKSNSYNLWGDKTRQSHNVGESLPVCFEAGVKWQRGGIASASMGAVSVKQIPQGKRNRKLMELFMCVHVNQANKVILKYNNVVRSKIRFFFCSLFLPVLAKFAEIFSTFSPFLPLVYHICFSDECGIVAQISQPLADGNISAYYISTFSFDHALVSLFGVLEPQTAASGIITTLTDYDDMAS